VGDGFDIYFVSDCSAGVTQETHDDAKVRSPERAALAGVFAGHRKSSHTGDLGLDDDNEGHRYDVWFFATSSVRRANGQVLSAHTCT
jgi:hypothetical protein